MKKHDRVEHFLSGLSADEAIPGLHPCYLGFFTCFNRGDYYEAHDVLEHLWLATRTPERQFFQGLIQIAGAFVHLKKQLARPAHPTDGRRLGPAARLFRLGLKNIEPFRPRHLQLDVETVCVLCQAHLDTLEHSGFQTNPWSPRTLPRLHPESRFDPDDAPSYSPGKQIW